MNWNFRRASFHPIARVWPLACCYFPAAALAPVAGDTAVSPKSHCKKCSHTERTPSTVMRPLFVELKIVYFFWHFVALPVAAQLIEKNIKRSNAIAGWVLLVGNVFLNWIISLSFFRILYAAVACLRSTNIYSSRSFFFSCLRSHLSSHRASRRLCQYKNVTFPSILSFLFFRKRKWDFFPRCGLSSPLCNRAQYTYRSNKHTRLHRLHSNGTFDLRRNERFYFSFTFFGLVSAYALLLYYGRRATHVRKVNTRPTMWPK